MRFVKTKGRLFCQPIWFVVFANLFIWSSSTFAACNDTVLNGLVACYPFDGNASDFSTKGNHGIPQGNLQYVTGKLGQAAQFDGTSSYISIVANSNLKMQGAITLAAWIKPSEFPSGNNCSNILSDHSSMYNNGKIFRFQSNRVEFLLDAEGSKEVGYTWTELNVWKYIVATFDGGQMKLYIDGVLTNFVDNSRLIATNPNPILIGKSGWGEYFKGLIDQLRIYDRALTQAEITELYNEPNSASCGLFTQAQIDAVKQACKTDPASCGITLVDTNGSTQTGIDQCKANPASCSLFTQAQIDAAKQACKTDPASCGIVIDQCKTNPASCGLFTQAQLDAAKQACKTDPASCGIVIIDQCKTNPASCSLFTQAQIDAAKQAGITQCKTTPASCGITLIDSNGSTQAGIAQCKANPASCGITKIDGISTNALVTPANKMIAGVLISGGTKRLMVRASSIDGKVDPQLDIFTYPDRKLLGSNDSWATDLAAAELTQKKLAPAHATDAAMIINLPPGLFTMEITSKNGGSGAGIIEVYDMAVFP